MSAVIITTKVPPPDRRKSDTDVLVDYYLERLQVVDRRVAEANKIKDRQRRRDELTLAGEARYSILQDIENLKAKDHLKTRLIELSILEARRGGDVVVEERVMQVPQMRNGRPHMRGGQLVTKPQLVVTQKATARDGLETLATSHLTAAGEQRKNRDGSPMLPAIDRIQHVALTKYREIYETADPERTLGAIDLEAVRMVRAPVDPFERGDKAQKQQIRRVLAGYKVVELEEKVAKIIMTELADDPENIGVREMKVAALALRALREVAGKCNTVRSLVGDGSASTRMVAALVLAADILVDHFGL